MKFVVLNSFALFLVVLAVIQVRINIYSSGNEKLAKIEKTSFRNAIILSILSFVIIFYGNYVIFSNQWVIGWSR